MLISLLIPEMPLNTQTEERLLRPRCHKLAISIEKWQNAHEIYKEDVPKPIS